ncbi:MAG: transaldolase, partial [Candidatus Cybelea sp.]
MKNQVQQLLDAGQSVWLDNVRRSMFASGELDRLIANGLRGMTSNPTIFEKAIGAGTDYDEQLAQLIGSEKSADALFWDLAIADIQSACDAFAPVFASSGGNDGFVSLEVSPLLANDTAGTIAMVKELWDRVRRPNVMIKIPGTKEGLPAIEESIYQGYNINVTLIFSVEMYEKAALAYVKGLRRRVEEGKPIDKIRSVNSVFVSRIDTAVDKLLQERIAKGDKLEHLLGKTGIAGLRLTYQKFKEIFLGDEFAALKSKGAAVQRPLWASTSTKNPHYPDLMYVESVVGPDTVNTMPPATLDALLDHGKIVPDTVESDLRGADDVMRGLREAKISLFEVTHQLQIDGVTLFCDSFAALLGAIVYKQKLLASGGAERVHLSLGKSQPGYDTAIEKLATADFLKRLWAHDASLWSAQPDAVAIIKKSLGWLDIQQHML